MHFDHYQIRPLVAEDLESYYQLVERNRERLANFFTGTVSRTQTYEATKEFLSDMLNRAEQRTYFPFVIVDTDKNQLAGFLDLKNIDWNLPKSEVGCYMDEAYAGKGIAQKAFCPIASGTLSIPTTLAAFLAINWAMVPVPVYKSYTTSLPLRPANSRVNLYKV